MPDLKIHKKRVALYRLQDVAAELETLREWLLLNDLPMVESDVATPHRLLQAVVKALDAAIGQNGRS